MTSSFYKKIAAARFNTQQSKQQSEQSVEPLSQSMLAYKAVFKTFMGLFNPKLWWLGFMPLFISMVLWAGLSFFFWDSLVLMFSTLLAGVELPTWLPAWLPSRTVWIALIILLLSMPLVMITALILVNILGTQTIAHRVAKQYGVPVLDSTALQRGSNTLRSVWHSAWVLLVLVVLWIMSLPLWLIAGLGLVVQLLLMAWANTRLFSYDILMDFADKPTRTAVIKQHRNTLFVLGIVSSIPAFLPSMLWLSGGLFIVFLPLMAFLAVWISIMIFLVANLLFSYYLMPALLHYQREQRVFEQQIDAQINGEIIEATVTERQDTPSTAQVLNKLS
jgi:hypothetical protein